MALRIRDGWLNGDFGLTASLRGPEAVIWDESAWADQANRWASLWDHAAPSVLLGGGRPLSKQFYQPLRADDGDPDGGSGPSGAPTPPGGDGPQFAGDAIGDNISSSTTIAVGGSLSSVIDHAGDLDFIKVNLVAGQTYTFSLDGSTLNDAYLELRDASGAVVDDGVLADDGGILRDAFMMHRATATGEYWIVARHWNNSGTGAYTLDVDAIQTGNSSPTDFPDNGKVEFSWEEAAIQISRDGAGWMTSFGSAPPTVITYAFRSSAPASMPTDTSLFSRFNAAQITAAESALAAWAAVANVVFQRVDAGDGYSNNATILFANYGSGADGAAAFAFLPNNGNTAFSSVEGDVWVGVGDPDLSYNVNPVRGGYGYQVLLHEIGHALGLTHPGEYNAGEGEGPIEYPTHAEYFNDSRVFTAMSYFGSSPVGGNLSLFASLPQLHDIAAIQRLYGANMASRTGDTIYGYNSNTGVPEYSLTLANQGAVFAVWDGGGIDTLDLSGYTTVNTIDLREEGFSSVGGSIFNLSIARGAVIENAIGGSGADTIIGNAANNTLNGGAGADALTGGLGIDTIQGGAGNDTIIYAIGDGAGTIDGGADSDTLNIADQGASSTLSVTYSGTGLTNAAGNALTSVENVNANMGAGTDWLIYSAAVAVAVNLATGAASGFTFISNIENVVGGSGDDSLTGNALGNVLGGGAGNDTLDGGGGADQFDGGAGDDTYIIDVAADFVWEAVGAGTDTVISSVNNYSLRNNFENIVLAGLTANGGGNALNNIVTGNAAANVLWGGEGNDTLDGLGGADQLNGQAGDDTYIIEDAGDFVWEAAGAGDDTVISSVNNYSLRNNFEHIVLAGSTANGGGNGLDNTVTGNAANNILWGGDGDDVLDGLEGADQLNGQAGNDTYIIDHAGDFVWEAVGAGTDTVISSVNNYSLRNNFEHLILAGSTANGGGNGLDNTITGNAANNILWGGAGNDTITGDGGADQLSGESGNDRLDGGLGADQLFGGADSDTYVFSSALGGDNVDVIFGFSAADDAIELDVDVFSAIALGTLDVNAFVTGSAAADAEDRIIYNPVTGALYYDADGSEAGAAIQFATLNTGLTLTNDDFFGA